MIKALYVRTVLLIVVIMSSLLAPHLPAEASPKKRNVKFKQTIYWGRVGAVKAAKLAQYPKASFSNVIFKITKTKKDLSIYFCRSRCAGFPNFTGKQLPKIGTKVKLVATNVNKNIIVGLSYLVDRPPTITLMTPQNQERVSPATEVSFTAEVKDSEGSVALVQFYKNGERICSLRKAPYQCTTLLSHAGVYSFYATAKDNHDLVTTSKSISVKAEAPVENKAPVASITAPTGGVSAVAPASFMIVADAQDSDGTITEVQFYKNDTLLCTDEAPPYTCAVTDLAAGSYAFGVIAKDNNGKLSSKSAITAVVTTPVTQPSNDPQPPVVAITAPGNGFSSTAPATLTVKATASVTHGTVTKVEFLRGDTVVCTDTTAPYECVMSNLSSGTYSLSARATNNINISTQSTAVTVQVNPPPNSIPSVSISSPTSGSTYTAPASFTVKAIASDSDGTVSRVEFLRNNSNVCSDTSAPYECVMNNVAPGTYTLLAKVTDNSNAVAQSSSVTVTVTAPPITSGTLQFSYPSAGRVNAHWQASEISARAKIFSTNETPLSNGVAPIAVASRLFPSGVPSTLTSGTFITTAGSSPLGLAGWWDDVSLSADNYHSRMNMKWSGSGTTIDLNNQKMQFSQPTTSFLYYNNTASAEKGVNFSTQSTAGMGHHIHESVLAVLEKNYTSLNIVDAGPACHSFAENKAEELFDSYDAIVPSRYNSIGCSTSEVPGVNKMYIAGGYLTRDMKDLLKSTGNYGIFMNYLFRKALPWVKGDGTDVPIDSEIRNRVAYFSRGSESSGDGWAGYGNELLTYNRAAHRYDNTQHLINMMNIAAALPSAPPVPVMQFVNLSVRQGTTTVLAETSSLTGSAAKYVPLSSAFTIRARAQYGQTVALTIDLADSFDLSGKSLNFRIKALHPNHQPFVSITKLTGAKVQIQFTADPSIPLGRVPVSISLNNGEIDGMIATVNFLVVKDINNPPAYTLNIVSYTDPQYWYTNKYYYHNRDDRARFTNNLRPVITATGATSQAVPVNGSATFTLNCTDPEGFATSWYKGSRTPGKFVNATQYVVQATEVTTTQNIDLICSDGTGVYTGTTIKVCPPGSGSC